MTATEPTTHSTGPTVVCTIISKNYLAYARTLMESLRRFHDDLRLVTLLVDTVDSRFDPAKEPFETLLAGDLGIPRWKHFAMKYDIMELNTAVKPYFLEVLMDRFEAAKVVYLDPDIVAYRRIDVVLDWLDRHDVVLTPHILGPIDDGRSPSELDFLRVGTYNLGFFGIARRGRYRELLKWWQSKVYKECTKELERGIFVDQHWIDLVPGFFDRVGILRDPGYNVAYWNFKNRALEKRGGGYEVNGSPLALMHFSGFSIDDVERISKHQNRFVLSDLNEHYRTLFEEYGNRLRANGHETASRLPYAYGAFEDGAPVSYPLRVCLRHNDPDAERWPDPFELRSEDNFRDWATSPAAGGRWRFLSPYALTLHELEPGLQARYPLRYVAKDVARWFERDFARWFVHERGSSTSFHPIYVDPVKEAMRKVGGETVSRAEAIPARENGAVPLSGRLSSTIRYFRAYPAEIAPFVHPLSLEVSPEIYTGPGGVYGWMRRKLIGLGVLRRVKRLLGMRLILTARYFFSYPDPGDLPLPDAFSEATPRRAAAPSAARPPRLEPATSVPATVRGRKLPPSPRPGVNVIGYTLSETGVGQVARSLLRCLGDAGYPVSKLTIQAHDIARKLDRAVDHVEDGLPHSINVFNVNADSTHAIHGLLGRAPCENRYNVAYWFWELSRFPERWLSAFDPYDEIWVSSAFALTTVSEHSPVPVVHMPVAIEVPLPDVPRGAPFEVSKISSTGATLPPTRIVLPDGAFLVLYVFDALSIVERKNPWGAVQAFERAFREAERKSDARLVIKVTNLSQAPELEAERLRQEVARVNGILIDGYLDRLHVNALIQRCDAYLSLHRSEGFGLTLAEAMYLGKPVVATAYSGNMDFMTPGNSFLVPYELVTLQRTYPPYDRGCVWADPDVEAAARFLRRSFEHPEEGRRIGQKAAADIRRLYAPQVVAEKVVARLELIRSRILGARSGTGEVREASQWAS